MPRISKSALCSCILVALLMLALVLWIVLGTGAVPQPSTAEFIRIPPGAPITRSMTVPTPAPPPSP
jgi:hypothetical protein